MDPLTFQQARQLVVRTVQCGCAIERVALHGAAGRILAEDVAADRDCPAVDRSVRDGYAVRAADVPGELTLVEEVRAGESASRAVGPGEAAEIMTGAPVPAGADAIVMVEHAERIDGRVRTARSAEPRQFIDVRGCQAKAGEIVLRSGERLDYSGVAALACFGHETVNVYGKPLVSILPTGDELVEVGARPRESEIRNSNSSSLAAQVVRAGGVPLPLPVARDNEEQTRELIERALDADLVLLSGGVSAGKYDVVERVLASLGAEVLCDRVLVQPGQPLVFGMLRGKPFFGLPGNPASTMVTFEVFARAALERVSGLREPALAMPYARLTRDVRVRPGLTRFLPARLGADGTEVTPVPWSGSGDIPAMSRANAYLVTEPDRAEYAAGELIRVMLK